MEATKCFAERVSENRQQELNLHISYSAPLDPQHCAAAGEHVLSSSEALARLGHCVDLIHLGETCLLANSVIKEFPVGLRRHHFRREIVHALELLRRSRRSDVVYHRFAKSSWLPVFVAKLFGKKVVLEVNADLRTDLQATSMSWVKKRLIFLMESINLALADHIVAVSRGVAYSLERHCGVRSDRITVVANGTNIKTFVPLDRTKCRRQLELPIDCRCVAFAGTFQRWQGLQTLIDASAVCARRIPDIQIILVGDGPERTTMECLVRKHRLEQNVRFLGWQKPETTAVAVGASDLCLAPYSAGAAIGTNTQHSSDRYMKGSPLKLYMYMACGRPIIASDFADCGRFLENIGAGKAVAPDDPQALADEIIEMLLCPGQAMEMGKNGAKYAARHCSWDTVTKKIVQVIRSSIATR